MTKEIRKELNQARRLYKAGKREEAFEIYDRHFQENPDLLDHWDKIRYCWTIYYLHIKDSDDEDELCNYAEIVTETVRQEDMKKAPVCVYTRCVFKLLDFYKKADDWDYVLYWLDKLDPELLSKKQGSSADRTFPSNKEKYYSLKSKALLEVGEFTECIEVSKKALDTFTEFALNGDVWHKFRIAKSLRELDEPREALAYLDDAVEIHDKWYILKEFAENYHMLDDNENALRYAGEAITADGLVNMKVNVFYLVFKILKDTDYDLALKHAKLLLAIKLEKGSEVPEDIEELDIDEDDLDIYSLEQEIKNHWIELEFQNG